MNSVWTGQTHFFFLSKGQDKIIATVHEALGEPAFQSAWDAGQRLTMKEAVEFALKEN